MRIVIDARMWQQSGIGRYLRNLIFHLQILDKENEYFILHLIEDYNTAQYQKNFHKVLSDFKWYGLIEQRRLPKMLNDLRPDLVHFPNFNVPIFYAGKFVVTIHDLIHQHYSMKRATTLDPFIYKLKQFGYKKVFGFAIKRSCAIFTPTNFVRDQLINEWEVSSEKIKVTYEAVDDKIISLAKDITEKQSQEFLVKFKIRKPYIFYVGNAHPHKNIEGLIRVFLKFKERYKGLRLVLSGNDHFFWQRLKAKFREKEIIFTGFVTDLAMVSLYKKAKAFVMPSFEEGFGLPVLEAMASGTPVTCSNIAVLKEIGLGACLYFNPNSFKDMSDKIGLIITDEKLASRLIEKGQARYKQFSWEKLARETLLSYNSCA